jgi:hypothetical protein
MQVDTWSFACTIWEVLHGCSFAPFFSPDDNMTKHMTKQQLLAGEHLASGARPAIPAEWRERCPALVELMEVCWEWHPSKRPAMAEVAARLAQILDNLTDEATT